MNEVKTPKEYEDYIYQRGMTAGFWAGVVLVTLVIIVLLYFFPVPCHRSHF